MFSWFKKKEFRACPPPKPVAVPPASSESAGAPPAAPQAGPGSPAAPGSMYPDFGVRAKMAFANAGRTWDEQVDLIELAGNALREEGQQVVCHNDWIELRESGMILRPRLRAFQPMHPQGAQTTTTIALSHPRFGEKGIYEYQHSTGQSTADALGKGFQQWCKVDLAVLLDALQGKPKACMVMQADFPAEGRRAARTRRGVMGPVAHLRQRPEPQGEEHPFCACCFFTRTMPAFKRFFEDDGFYALRFFGMRDQDGQVHADCRVNGDEFEDGKDAIRQYVQSWPDFGFEFRKQYVVFQDWTAGLEKQWRE